LKALERDLVKVVDTASSNKLREPHLSNIENNMGTSRQNRIWPQQHANNETR